jgi:hypothetical protein
MLRSIGNMPIADREDAILEVDVAPTGVHDFLLPRTRAKEELKQDPTLPAGTHRTGASGRLGDMP